MTQLDEPVVNGWYRLPDTQTFRVVTADMDHEFVQIQYSDGSLEGLDAEIWSNSAQFRLSLMKNGSVSSMTKSMNLIFMSMALPLLRKHLILVNYNQSDFNQLFRLTSRTLGNPLIL